LSSFLLLSENKIEFRKEYFEIPWASMRAMVEPSIAKRSVINHREYFTNGQVITSSAVNVTETEVSTADGQLIPYDFLVIATGHSDPVPESKTERLNQYKAGKSIGTEALYSFSSTAILSA
jgi:NAD(P)H-nitrite reductase large subunit